MRITYRYNHATDSGPRSHLFDHSLYQSVGGLNVVRIGALQKTLQQRRLLAVLEDGVLGPLTRWQWRRRCPVRIQLWKGERFSAGTGGGGDVFRGRAGKRLDWEVGDDDYAEVKYWALLGRVFFFGGGASNVDFVFVIKRP